MITILPFLLRVYIAFLLDNGYDQAVSDINQPRTTGATEMVLSQKVTQSVPQTGLSPVLEKYKEYLRSCYNARALAPADKYLPTLEAPYINLAMIEREQSYNPDQRDEFTWHTLHGGIDQILQYKTCINIESLLTPEDSAKPVRFILVEGPPGIGKSTFAWEVCRRWDEIESLRHYHTVVLLKLREKWVLNALSLSDLLRYPSHPDFSASISDELVQSQGEKCLFVLDGFDEVSHRFHENSAIKSILCRQLLPKCTIILTTRPVAKVTLRSICQPRIYKHVEIIGFTEEERVRYITEVFSEKKELQEKFLKHMFLVPHIKSMMYIPLNCAIIAQVYYESQSSHHLAIPRTRTQLYKALTNSLLVRHMKKKEGNHEYTSTLPEGLNEEDMGNFKALAMFAFDSYHKGYSKKVTFFQEDIPKGLVHFGFMNESTEMYAEKAVERTFSFLHLSLQEYLAAWHLANICSIEFQVAYHRLAIGGCSILYKGDNEDEKALISSLKQHGSSLVEPAMFLAGITGWKYQSWKNYLNHDTAGVVESSAFLRPLYETQNPEMVSHYFSGKCTQYSDKMAGIPPISLKKKITIDSDLTPYDCYAISYCLAYSSDQDQFSFSLNITSNHISYVETFVKGLDDHCKSVTPRVNYLQIYTTIDDIENVDKCLSWILKVKFLAGVQNAYFDSKSMKSSLANQLIESLAELKSLKICVGSHTPWEWLVSLNFPSKLEILHIYGSKECRPLPNDLIFMLEGDALKNVIFDIQFPSNTIYELCSPIDSLINSVVESVLGSSQITQIVLPNISRKTMAGVHSILLQCPSLTSLELKGTRLGYDGIIFICSALRKNGRLKNLVIHDDLQLPPSRSKRTMGDIKFSCFSSVEKVDLPDKSTCTDFLLVLNNILEGNTTLEKISIKSGLFLPLSAGECRDFCQWTGLGPLQQFNVGAIARGTFPNLRRSFSLSNLTQPQAVLFWDKRFLTAVPNESADINFQELFSKRKEEGNKFSRPSFTAPDCEVLQSFSGLDPRLMKCLEISEQFLLPPTHPVNETSTYNHRKRLSETFNRMCAELTKKMNIE